MAKLTQIELNLGYCEEAQTYCSVAEERYKQGRADMLNELFNTPIEEFNGMSLKEVYEQPCSMPFDEGWNECYENFLMVAEYLKEQNK